MALIWQNLPRLGVAKLCSRVTSLIPRHCLLCLNATHSHFDLCHRCLDTLALNNHCCQRCATPMDRSIDQDIVLCGNCLSHHYYYDQVYSPYLYSEEISYLIRKFKYQKKVHYADLLSQLFIRQITQLPDFQLPRLIIPVPMHNKRLRQRGFNQALELGRLLANWYSIPLQYTSLIRVRDTRLQAGLLATQRQTNMHRAFALKQPLDYEHIALVDDVMTTGSTANEAARQLKHHGIKQVDVWTIARAGLSS